MWTLRNFRFLKTIARMNMNHSKHRSTQFDINTTTKYRYIHRSCITLNKLRRDSSALFVSNSVAQKISDFDVHLDLDKFLEDDLTKTHENLRRRNIKFDLDEFCTKYQEYKRLLEIKNQLEQERKFITEQIESCKTVISDNFANGGPKPNQDIEEMSKAGQILRGKLKELMPKWWIIEEEVKLTGLRLPNSIDDVTPDKPLVLTTHGIATMSENNQNSHVSRQDHVSNQHHVSEQDHVFLGQKDGLIKFSNIGRKAYYLFNEAASLEQQLIKYVSHELEKFGYRAIVGPDLFRSCVVEGCGLDFTDENETIRIKDDGKKHPKIDDYMYLSGASLQSIAAYLAKTRVNDADIPMKFFAKGRGYSASAPLVTDSNGLPWRMDDELLSQHDSELNCLHPSLGLYEALQTSVFHAVILSGCPDNNNKLFNSPDNNRNIMIKEITQLFNNFQLPFRTMQIPADQLHLSEKSRVEFQLYSHVLDKFITTAYVSDVGDFVSRRLEILTERSQYCGMCHGCVFDVTKSIASCIENYYDTKLKCFKLPNEYNV